MNVFFEEDGSFKAGSVLLDQGGAFQVESATGKRTKVKAGHVLIEFRDPAPIVLLRDAQALCQSMDVDFLWQCAPAEEFAFSELGGDYFGRAPSAVESAALLMCLHGAPMYFYRKGKGRYRAAPAEALTAALASVERKRIQAETQARYVSEIVDGRLPEAVRIKAAELIFRPDKNSIEFKALEEAASALSLNPARLMVKLGGFRSTYDLHLQRFLYANFPRGRGHPVLAVVPPRTSYPQASVTAFSIDDHTTTEIDDAFSVEAIDGGWRIGIHIAAPGLVISPGDAVDQIARERYSTVYMPGDKITMLPESVVNACTLAAGSECLVISLYVELDGSDWSVTGEESRIERIRVADNLRHNDLDGIVTLDALEDSTLARYPYARELSVLWGFAKGLYAGRQEARVAAGLKPETVNRADFNFYIEERDGVESVTISERKRGEPLDKIVAELMIFANAAWGKLLADRGTAAIYRTQQGFGAAGRVRMATHPAPHQGLGVAQYAWSSSPLRRYVDLVNQWQLIALLEDGAPPFSKNDTSLFAIVAGFDAAYAAYAEFQAAMERFWCLRWTAQQGQKLFEALVTREDWVRMEEIPLQFRVAGLPALARGTRVELEWIGIDELELTLACRLVAIIEEVEDESLISPDEGEADMPDIAAAA